MRSLYIFDEPGDGGLCNAIIEVASSLLRVDAISVSDAARVMSLATGKMCTKSDVLEVAEIMAVGSERAFKQGTVRYARWDSDTARLIESLLKTFSAGSGRTVSVNIGPNNQHTFEA